MSHKKFGPDRFSRFDVYWIQTNKQTNRQTDRQTEKPNLYIDKERGKYSVGDIKSFIKKKESKKRHYIYNNLMYMLYICSEIFLE